MAAEGAGIHFCLAFPALYLPCIPLFSRVSLVTMSAVVGVGQELGGDSAGSTNHSLHFFMLVSRPTHSNKLTRLFKATCKKSGSLVARYASST